jgi:hypothetical protein
MNQTFSLARFARLNRWFWATKSRSYIIGAIALLPVMSMMPLQALQSYGPTILGAQRNDVAFFLILAIFVSISLGSDVFSALFKQESAISYLMIPASRTEKFWLGVLYCVVALLLFSLAFFGIEAFIFNIANSRLPASEHERYVSSLVFYTSPANFSKSILPLTVFLVVKCLAVTILGSFFFRRGVLVRNAGLFLLLLLGLTLLYVWIVSSLAGGHQVGTALPFFAIAVHQTIGRYELLAPPAWLMYGAYAGTLLMLWVIARVRFNELER